MSKSDDCELSVVGQYDSTFNDVLGMEMPCADIFLSTGLIVHLRAHNHSNCIPYMEKIPEIIAHPDYIGCHPTIPNSIELIKKLDENLLVAIKLDPDDNYLYISSFYEVKESKIQRRLNSGRLKTF